MLPHDPHLPSLNSAVSAGIVEPLLRKLISDGSHGALRLERCKVDRFRYRPAERAIVLYQLELTRTDDGTKLRTWASGYSYRGNKAAKLASTGPSTHPERVDYLNVRMDATALLDELDLFIQLFPVDRHMPAITTIMAGKDVGLIELLKPRQGDDRELGKAKLSFEPMRYRPGVGATVRATLGFDSGAGEMPTQRAFAKIMRETDPADALIQWQQMGAAADRAGKAFDLARPIGVSATTGALAIAPARGASLEDILLSDRPLGGIARRAAEALAALHKCDAALTRTRTDGGSARRVRRSTDFIAWALPHEERRLADLTGRISTALESGASAPTHLDLKADHVFADDDHISFIDLDSAAISDPILDPAQLIARMHVMPLLMPIAPQRISDFRNDFLAHYCEFAPRAWTKRYAAAYGAASLKVALFFLQHLVPGWPEHISAILDDIEATLAARDPMASTKVTGIHPFGLGQT